MAKKITKKERKRAGRNAFVQRMLSTGTETVFAGRRYIVGLPDPRYHTRVAIRKEF